MRSRKSEFPFSLPPFLHIRMKSFPPQSFFSDTKMISLPPPPYVEFTKGVKILCQYTHHVQNYTWNLFHGSCTPQPDGSGGEILKGTDWWQDFFGESLSKLKVPAPFLGEEWIRVPLPDPKPGGTHWKPWNLLMWEKLRHGAVLMTKKLNIDWELRSGSYPRNLED